MKTRLGDLECICIWASYFNWISVLHLGEIDF